jgi:hypothetical protein
VGLPTYPDLKRRGGRKNAISPLTGKAPYDPVQFETESGSAYFWEFPYPRS